MFASQLQAERHVMVLLVSQLSATCGTLEGKSPGLKGSADWPGLKIVPLYWNIRC